MQTSRIMGSLARELEKLRASRFPSDEICQVSCNSSMRSLARTSLPAKIVQAKPRGSCLYCFSNCDGPYLFFALFLCTSRWVARRSSRRGRSPFEYLQRKCRTEECRDSRARERKHQNDVCREPSPLFTEARWIVHPWSVLQ